MWFLIRNKDGGFVQGFMHKLDEGDSLLVDIRTCVKGLNFAWNLGFKKVVLELNAAYVVELLQKEIQIQHGDFQVLLHEALELMRRN